MWGFGLSGVQRSGLLVWGVGVGVEGERLEASPVCGDGSLLATLSGIRFRAYAFGDAFLRIRFWG